MSKTALPNNKPVLFFDGVCNLCNKAVQFVIKHDKRGLVHFATLQSGVGLEAKKAVVADYGKLPDSLIFLDNGKYYTESAAALRMAGYLDGGYKLLKALLLIPGFVRNPVYRFVARNRYKWFGKQDECMLPTPELKSRFLN